MPNLTVICTNACNYSCPWCRRKEQLNTNDTISRKDLLSKYKELIKNRVFSGIGFSGGEPLLEPEFLLYAIQETRELYPSIDIAVKTNGSLLTDALVSFFNFYSAHCSVSIEGINSGYKSLEQQNKNLRIQICNLKSKDITKVIKPNTRFATDAFDLYKTLNPIKISLSLDETQQFNITDILLIQAELQRLKEIRSSISIQRSSECFERPCYELQSDGSFIAYDCSHKDDLKYCPMVISQFADIKTLQYFMSMADRFKQGLL